MSKEREPQPKKLTIEQVSSLARETALRYGGHQPMLFVQGGQDTVVLTMEKLEATHEGRLEQMRTAGWMVGSKGTVGALEQVFFVSEAWLSIRDTDEAATLLPSQDPKRKEVLIISMLNADEAKVDIQLLEMIRDSKNDLTAIQPFAIPKEEGVGFDLPLLRGFLEGYVFGLMDPAQDD